jgi:hypothetical protein
MYVLSVANKKSPEHSGDFCANPSGAFRSGNFDLGDYP